MTVTLIVRLEVQLLDEDGNNLPDPPARSPLANKMHYCVTDAVQNALKRGENNGFSHEMDDALAIEVDDVALAAN